MKFRTNDLRTTLPISNPKCLTRLFPPCKGLFIETLCKWTCTIEKPMTENSKESVYVLSIFILKYFFFQNYQYNTSVNASMTVSYYQNVPQWQKFWYVFLHRTVYGWMYPPLAMGEFFFEKPVRSSPKLPAIFLQWTYQSISSENATELSFSVFGSTDWKNITQNC